MSKSMRMWRRPLAVAAVSALALGLPVAAGAVDANQQSRFGRMFPGLAVPVEDAPSNESLVRLAGSMLDAGKAQLDIAGTPSGFTYFGQFIDHDLTLDGQALPSVSVDPTTLFNGRTAAFDLDSVYGRGPALDPQLYEADHKHLRVQEEEDQVNGVPDLVRDPQTHRALLAEPRNDENAIIAQLHVAFLKFHNQLVDEGKSFAEAQRLTRWHYQWVVVNDYLPHVVGQDRVDRFLKGTRVVNEFYKPGDPKAPMTPTEFSTAIFRYGHSQVRDSYEMNDLSEDAPIKVFDLTDGAEDLRGAQDLTERTHIDWAEFFEIDGAPEFEGNLSRQFDTKISESLFNLPSGAPGVPGQGTNVLGQRNLIRGKFYGLPTGQDVARAMGIPVLTNKQLGLSANAFPDFNGEAPLWFYMLAESKIRENGARLGPVGGRVIAEVFLTQIAIDPASYLNARRPFTPSVEPGDTEFTIGDFLTFAGVVELEEEEE
jgi:Animal haem peroxidase